MGCLGRITATLWLVQAASAGAQTAPASVAGTVVDSAGRPLEGVEVELIGVKDKILTNKDGSFRFGNLRPARAWLFLRRIGYLPSQLSLTINKGTERDLTIVMAARPFELPELVARAEDRRYRSKMRDFLWRSRTAFGGRFLTQDDIGASRVNELGQLVIRYMPFKSLWVMNQAGGWGDPYPWFANHELFPRSTADRLYRSECPPAVSLNGAAISPGWAVNDFDPSDVEALEIYRDGQSLPPEFDFAHRTACGLVVVWLKSYATR